MATKANIKAAKELVKLYNSMTIEKIDNCKEPFDDFCKKQNALTGFGNSETCTLCKSIIQSCPNCIYNGIYGCINGKFKASYVAIAETRDSESLLKAYKERAKVISKLLKSIK